MKAFIVCLLIYLLNHPVARQYFSCFIILSNNIFPLFTLFRLGGKSGTDDIDGNTDSQDDGNRARKITKTVTSVSSGGRGRGRGRGRGGRGAVRQGETGKMEDTKSVTVSSNNGE